ncbi:MAG: urease accessory protein [Betaproteobacteria bacterium]|nr:urease accessory protein [Betaproteobacteria bacterium]
MRVAEPIFASWRAELALGFERAGPRTVLARRRHDGPLVVQKPLYPEGGAVCHAIVVHPPGGIAGGDALEIAIDAGAGSHALLTTPGAGKWYRSAGPEAGQSVRLDVAAGAMLEWLPQETILFSGARARLATEVRLQGDAGYLGWEIVCLGRTGSGERFATGESRFSSAILRDGRPLWLERGCITGDGVRMASAAVLAAQPVFGTLAAAFPAVGHAELEACRAVSPEEGRGAATLLPGVLLARYLGASTESARRWFSALWRILRPACAGREAVEPRIWRT